MSQYGNCTNCGANLTPEDYQQPACRYCGTAFLHHQEAAAKVAELQAVMGAMRPPMPYGAPMLPPGQPVVVPGMVPIQHASAQYVGSIPTFGASPPPGGPMPASPPPGGRPFVVTPARANRTMLFVIIGVVVVTTVIPLLVVVIGVVVRLLL